MRLYSPTGLRPGLERLEAVVEPGDGDLGVGGGPRRVDDADEGERVLQHHRDDRGQLQAVGLQHQLQQVPAMFKGDGVGSAIFSQPLVYRFAHLSV